ncbi:(R)-hydratase [Rhodococcoides trifolii]|uniref:(R)-hydratase n=1 Tax=Rhodococcoides trifolii TaxID=908250 RepID=A0A917FWJ7_9NOCA|nr:fused (3R)-hydroxyacyl-ACP dehydratase subunits HadA/HadB [Rhodococcus trifolii]GGG07735.1 (R)-hydratase [Rhodococcus trifolii]
MSIDDRTTESSTDAAFDPADHARAMVGYHYRVDDYYEVGREKLREYAKAVQDLNPVHWSEDAAAGYGYDGLIAPLTFISLVGTLAQKKLLATIATGYDLSQMLQTDQVIEYYTPIKSGDRLVCDVSLDSFRQIVGRDMMVTKNIVSNQLNELVQITYTTLLIGRKGDIDESVADAARGMIMHGMTSFGAGGDDTETELEDKPTYDEPVTPPHTSAATQRFDDVAVGDELPPRTVELTRGDLVNYAGVAGDANPVHWSDAFAHMIDLETVVAHGMLTMGVAAGYLTTWLGDPGAVRDYTVRFTSPVSVHPDRPAELQLAGKVKSLDPETRTAVVSLDARFNGKRILGHRATATVQLA